MKRKLAIAALALSMVVSNVAPYATMTVHAEESDEIGDILDDVFGGNKPDNSQGTGTTGGGTDNIDWDNMNKPQNGGSDNSGSNTGNSGNSGSDNGGSSNSGNTGSNAGSSTTVTDPDTGKTTTTTANADGSTTVVTTDPATGKTTSVIVSAGTTTAVDVTDPAILALLPEAMIVTAPSGLPFVHALDVSRTVYSVWGGGQQLDAFFVTDAAGTPVAMQAVDIVTGADGKTYVNVTIDPAIVGATVQAAEEQRVAFAKHYGIDGVMINGVLADTFVALAA